MTQVKLWQIVSQTPNTIVFSDANGNLTTIPAGGRDQVLVVNANGVPEWVNNAALSTALEAKTDATSALNTAKAYADAQIAALVDNAPVALNTLNELAVKLNGEDSAINALLLQVDGKAEKTEVTTAVAQAKQDAIQTSKDYTDTTVADAQADTLRTANSFTTQSVTDALASASTDAALKADAAKTSAIAISNSYTDTAIATQAQASATDATQKANQAQATAISDAHNYTDTKISDLPSRLFAQTTATACLVLSTNGVDPTNGVPLSGFAEVTGANLAANAVLTPKLLFVNGLAMSTNWTGTSGTMDTGKIQFGQQLIDHAFDGSDNAVMVLCEYTNKSSIIAVQPAVQFDNPGPQFG